MSYDKRMETVLRRLPPLRGGGCCNTILAQLTRGNNNALVPVSHFAKPLLLMQVHQFIPHHRFLTGVTDRLPRVLCKI